MAPLRIACLGWGSLLWDPRSLPMAGPFRDDGPRLPIEFSRIARDGRATLVARLDEAAARFEGASVPRPSFWSGFRIVPDRVEFWQGRSDRLHERTVFVRVLDGWTKRLLYP